MRVVLVLLAAFAAIMSSAIASCGAPKALLVPDGTPCTTGGNWNQNGLTRGGVCRPFHNLIKGVDDKLGGDGLSYQTVNLWQDVCQDNVSDGPVYASPPDQSSSHSFFDAEYHTTLGTGCKSLAYTNEEIMFDYQNELHKNTGGTGGNGLCTTQDDKRDTAFLKHINSDHGAESTPSPPATKDDVVHATPGPASPIISSGDGDSGRITGATTDCSQSPAPDATVQKYMMNPQADDIIGMAQDYLRGVLGSMNPYKDTHFTWATSTPPPAGEMNPNGSSFPTCTYDASTLGAFSCYDIFFLDQAAPHYNRGQSPNTWTRSFELDPAPVPTGVWDWTDSFPGVVAAEITFAMSVKHPTGGGPGDTGAAFPLWLNGFGIFNGGTRSDDSTIGAAVESCNADELGQNALGSNQGTAANILAGSIEDSWYDSTTQVPLATVWAANMNCASDIYAENSPTSEFAEFGGHSTAFDTPADGYDLSTTASMTVSANPSPQTIPVGSTTLNGATIGHNNPFALLVDAGASAEIVSVVDTTNPPSPTITAIFTKGHMSGFGVRALSPHSYRITAYALTLLAYVDGRSVVQMKYGTSHFDLPTYPEAMIYPGSPLMTMGTFRGNPVLTKSDAGIASPGPLATMVVHDTRDIQTGQTLNLFNSDRSSWEKVTVHAVARNSNTVTFDNVAFSHGPQSILRGTQAYDGCQMVGSPAVPEPDGAASGGIADYLITGTCGEDGTSSHRAAGVYCREFSAMTVYAGPTMNGAACVNMTNKSVTFNSLLAGTAGGTCPMGVGISYCLTHAYTHVCGAFDASDDVCLAETPLFRRRSRGQR